MSTLPELAALEAVSVYVHVPFCRSRCSYCNFYFETTRSPSLIEKTLEAIVREAESYSAALGRPAAGTIYLGGGTPSVVDPSRLARFIRSLRSCFAGERAPEEITVEANPESIDEGSLDQLGSAGVTRLSIGVQSFDDQLLATLGRRAREAQVRSALDSVDRYWTRRCSVDLISGIPGQTRSNAVAAVDEIAARNFDHASLYALTLEPGTPLAQSVAAGRTVLPSAEEQEELWLAAAERLESAGFEWYEVSNFGRAGDRSLHNSAYWRYEPYIGLGPGASATLPSADGSRVRITNGDLFRYLSAGPKAAIGRPQTLSAAQAEASAPGRQHAWRSVELLGRRERLFERFLCGLRTSEGVDIARAAADARLDPAALEAALGSGWSGARHLQRNLLAGGTAVLDRDGRLTLDRHLPSLAERIDRHLHDEAESGQATR